LAGALGVALLAGLGWVALWSPWATVETVAVTGTVRVSRAPVAAAAETELGRSMLLARTDQVAERIRREQPLAKAVSVTRRWPSTLRIAVTEREPGAAVPSGADVSFVEPDGVGVRRLPADRVRRAVAAGELPDVPRVEV